MNEFAKEIAAPAARPPAPVTSTDPERITPADIFRRRTVRRPELRKLVPLSDTTIYELEQKGAFPKRFYLTPRCVVWPLAEVLEWIDARRQEGREGCGAHPDYRQRAVPESRR
ncbi:helix-turn-helix transcriptional regulator [Henriciella aquimarina]|uniref:helix-turn-helix transcriptional regulator n=1 Tax=Henriciella aquimarina TaxID=545261 RepID=UPI001F2BD3EB